MGWFGRFLLGVTGLGLAGIVGLCLVMLTADPQRMSAQASAELSKLLGEDVSFAGTPSAGLWPLPGLHTGEVSSATLLGGGGTAVLIPNPFALIGGEDRLWGVVLVGSRLSVAPDTAQTLVRRLANQKGADGLGFLAMLAGSLEIGRGVTQSPIRRVSAILAPGQHLGLEMSGDWQGRAVTMTALAENAKAMFTATGAKITLIAKVGDDTLSYRGTYGRDAKTDKLTAYGVGAVSLGRVKPVADALGLQLPGLFARLTRLDGTLQSRARDSGLLIKLNAGGMIDGRTLSVQARLEGGPDWRETGPDTVSVVSRGGGMFSAYLDGTFSAARRIRGKLSISVLDIPRLQKWLGILPGTRLMDATRATIAADIRLNDDGFEIANGSLLAGEETIATTLKVVRGDPAFLTGQLSFKNLDLSALHQAGYDRLRLILSELEEAGVDLAVEIESASTTLQDLALGALQLGLAHRDGIAKVEIGRLEIMDGLLNGRVELATRGPARTTGQIAMAEIDAHTAAKFFGLGLVKGAVAGRAGFTIPDLTGKGGGLSKVEGRLTVLDGALMLPESALGPTTFRSANLNLKLAEGRIRIDDLTLRADGPPITGRLGVSMADKTLEGRLQNAKGTVVDLGGTMAAPVAKTIRVGEDKVDVAVATPEPEDDPTPPRATEEAPETTEPEPASDPPEVATTVPDDAGDTDTAAVAPDRIVEVPAQPWSETRATTLAAAAVVIAAKAERDAAAKAAAAAALAAERDAAAANNTDAAAPTDGSAESGTTTGTETTSTDEPSVEPADERTAEIDPRFPIPIPAPR